VYIKRLFIKSLKTESLIREINFRNGVNFIVDSSDGLSHNQVGKTTLLKLIDIIFGARDKSALYDDKDLKTRNDKLKAFIENNMIAATIELVDNIDFPKEVYYLTVELFDGGKRKIGDTILNLKKYNEELNLILFDNQANIPTFRQNIQPFIRVSLNHDNDQFLKFLDHGTINQYRAIYNYLFNISNPAFDKERDKLKKELNIVKKAKKKYMEINGFDDLKTAEENMQKLSNYINEVELKIDNIVSKDYFEKNIKYILKNRNEYQVINAQIYDLEYKIDRNNEIIENLTTTFTKHFDDGLSKDFFNEINNIVPKLNKTFGELIDFNNKLLQNKINYFKDIGEILQRQKEVLVNKVEEMDLKNKNHLSLIKDNKIEDYFKLTEILNEYKSEWIAIKENFNSLKRFEEEKNAITKRIESLPSFTKEKLKTIYSEKLKLFNTYFNKISNEINGEKPILIYNPDISEFPVSIKNIHSGTSTGTKKSLIAAYDISYQMFATVENKKVPKFVIHDVLESIEGDNLNNIIREVNESQSQYIIAILSEKLDSSQISKVDQERMRIIELSKSNLLFEGNIKQAGED